MSYRLEDSGTVSRGDTDIGVLNTGSGGTPREIPLHQDVPAETPNLRRSARRSRGVDPTVRRA